VIEALERAFDAPMPEACGLTESGARTFAARLPPRVRKPGGFGLPLAAETAVVDEAGRGLPQGAEGEVIVA